MRHSLYPALALLAATGSALARPLDPAACDNAKQEQAAMTDVPPLMERGPAWARANATPETLQRVARWIELTEILSFRCGRATLSAETQRAAAAADLIENPPPVPVAPAAAKLNSVPEVGGEAPAAASSPQPTAASAPQPAAATAEATVVKKAKAKPRPKPKPPVDATAPDAAPAASQAAATGDQPPPRKRSPKPADSAATSPTEAPAAQ